MPQGSHTQQVAEIMDLLRPDHTSPVGKDEPTPIHTKPGTLGQHVGQQQSQQFGQVFKSRFTGGRSDVVSVGFRTPGNDPYAAPYSTSAHWDHPDERPAAFLTVSRINDRHTLYRGGPDLDSVSQQDEHEWTARHNPNHQPTLFSSERGKPWTVEEMYAHPEATHAIPTMMGVAAQHTLSHSGVLPQASEDLSKHSSRLVHGLSSLGVIDAPRHVNHNNIDFSDGERNARTNVKWMQQERYRPSHDAEHDAEPSRELPASEVERAGNMFRSVVRGAKANLRRDEFDSGSSVHPGQGTLF